MENAWRAIRSWASVTPIEVRMDADSLTVNGEASPRPKSQQQYLAALRKVLEIAPRPQPDDGLPFSGGLVGVSGYDVVRLFERLPQQTSKQDNVPDAAFIAPSSLLVFDHLTRRVAILHDGPEAERQALRYRGYQATAWRRARQQRRTSRSKQLRRA